MAGRTGVILHLGEQLIVSPELAQQPWHALIVFITAEALL